MVVQDARLQLYSFTRGECRSDSPDATGSGAQPPRWRKQHTRRTTSFRTQNRTRRHRALHTSNPEPVQNTRNVQVGVQLLR